MQKNNIHSDHGDKEKLWEKHGNALRAPKEIFGTTLETAGITAQSLLHETTPAFTKLLAKLGITLLVSREYENLLIALSAKDDNLTQTFFHLPHPSGIAVDPKTNSVFVAATRNPNQIIEFKPKTDGIKRSGIPPHKKDKALMPVRAKYYAGAYYFHDLAFIGGKLYANSVGQNGIINVNMSSNSSDELVWWPKCIETKSGKPDTRANYIQLNSIAAGKTLRESFFSASGDRIRTTKPGDVNYPVDKQGVIFSGKTREAVAGGLTRPHSARFYGKELLVDNSGYGQVGRIHNGTFFPIAVLPGWTRGLYIIGHIAFVGTSRILPRFRQYAPGIDYKKAFCGIHAIDLKTGSVIGTITFPYGNQIFAIEGMSTKITTGFIYHSVNDEPEEEKNAFLTYKI